MAGKFPHTEFSVHINQHTETVKAQQLDDYAALYGIDSLIPDRYSHLFILNLYSLERYQGLHPGAVIQEIKALERGTPSYMKPETQFTRSPLRGLWHKHFFASLPSTFGHNLLNELGRNGVEKAVKTALDPAKGDRVTKEMISDLADLVVQAPLERRSDRSRLTGEWIVYAKLNNKNYYLTVASHSHGDEAIASNIRTVCCREFEWLQNTWGAAEST